MNSANEQTGPRYTHGHGPAVVRAYSWRTAANSAAYVLGRLRPNMQLLDVGCGPGSLTIDLARHVAPGRVLGVDSAPAAIELATAAARAAGVTAEFAIGDAYHLDVPDDSFDVVHAHQVLQHLADPVAALREWHRVVRPGGIVAARDSDYHGFRWWPRDPRLDRWLEIYDAVARANRGEPDAGRMLLGWAHEAGFTDVAAGASVWCFANPEDRGWWGSTWAERVTDSVFSRQAVSGGVAEQAELDGIAAAFRAFGDHPDGWFAVLHGEIIAQKE